MKKHILLISFMLIRVVLPVHGINASNQETLRDFSFEGIRFSYDSVLATDVEGEIVPAEPTTHGLPSLETGSQKHIRVSFDHDTAPGIFDPHDAQFLIFPVKDYRMIFEVVANTIDALHTLLTDKPDAIEGKFPFLPPMTTNQVFGVQMKYLNFQNGTGVRYITYYSQDVAEITNKDIFYIYQGLTADGKYYVSFIFPVSASLLPDEHGPNLDSEAFTSKYESYLAEISQALNELSVKDYIPDLTLLDTIIESLLVKPENLREVTN